MELSWSGTLKRLRRHRSLPAVVSCTVLRAEMGSFSFCSKSRHVNSWFFAGYVGKSLLQSRELFTLASARKSEGYRISVTPPTVCARMLHVFCVCACMRTNQEGVCLDPPGTYPTADLSGRCNEIWMRVCVCVCYRKSTHLCLKWNTV